MIIGVQYWIGRYSLTQSGDNNDGAMYADVNATLPAHSILAAISIAVAALFLVAAIRERGAFQRLVLWSQLLRHWSLVAHTRR